MDSFGVGAALHQLTLPGHFLRTLSEERWGQGLDERCHSSEKKENENTAKRKSREEERNQSTNFKEAACCSSALV